MTGLPISYLRLCAGCNAQLLLNYHVEDRDESVYCPTCQTGLAVVAEPGGRVRLFGEHRTFEFCVLDRDGEKLTLRRFGFPESEPFEISVNNVRPEFSYSRVQRGPAKTGQKRRRA